jgi:hypothetical protein
MNAILETVTYTHDRRAVYPHDTRELPEGAIGWTPCDVMCNGAYAVWCADEDRARLGHDIELGAKEAAALRTKAQAVAACEALGLQCYVEEKLRDLRLSYQLKRLARRWPLRQVRKP